MKSPSVRILFSILVCLSAYLPMQANALNFETLVMPGKVIKGHAKYEEQCDRCHESFSKKSQRRLCLDCHKKVASDIKENTGLHGRDSDIRTVECKRCHSDHLGRDADVVQFNKSRFNHDRTDFKLKLSHKLLACVACHKKGELYREAKSDCYSCHKDKDVHEKKFGQKCVKCHAADSWRKSSFDHNKTKYRLTGKHIETSCQLCHPNHRYKDVPLLCEGCHLINDIHNGRYGGKCQECHSTKSWKRYGYDHDKKTKFALKGSHKEARCNSCHKDDDYEKKLKRDCYSCHKSQDRHKENLGRRCGDCHGEETWRKNSFSHKNFPKTACYDCHKSDDVHQGRYGEECESCHKTTNWDKRRFDHDGETDFPLIGEHQEVACVLCHKGNAANERDKTACYQCHELDDVHDNKLGRRCGSCHNEAGWRKRVVFDHDLTRFPLVGLHASTLCESCHMDSKYRGTERECLSCHEADDDHDQRMGVKCGFCHNPNSWTFWQFDHDRQSKFKLKGAHKGIVCEACHRKQIKNNFKINKACVDCHLVDDVHNESFGRYCERCHNEQDFSQVEMPR